MKKLMALAFAVLPVLLYPEANPITLDWCQDSARANYPLIRQYGLIAEAEAHGIRQGYRPVGRHVDIGEGPRPVDTVAIH
jgi:hypothetical protein